MANTVFQIINYSIYLDGKKLQLLLFNIQHNTTYFTGNLIHSGFMSKMNIITNFTDFFNINTTGYIYYNIKGNKLLLNDIDTYIRIKEKRLIDEITYSALLINQNTNNHIS